MGFLPSTPRDLLIDGICHVKTPSNPINSGDSNPILHPTSYAIERDSWKVVIFVEMFYVSSRFLKHPVVDIQFN